MYPDASLLTYDIELLVHAVKLWKASDSALPPTPNELLYRDLVWDSDCSLVRNAIEYQIKKKSGDK